ncbi:hypothetical protein [Sulfidibacter corallicola]|uniref:Uncharacterized protein n=1 Tax=Sulfidibacter corallicola TaxID=2818388 RepID=A0A8A4TSW1_SULCO|nr:hypothetical protein [Sulfidibacter corallicola]QTD53049.1 hypothetical protein J3U87_11355 [Sulfidibacter corallicola]
MFLGLIMGILNAILIAVVIFILKQPDPGRGRQMAEMHELQERITELTKHLVNFEKKVESLINDSKNENLAKIERVNQDVGRQLKTIHDNL